MNHQSWIKPLLITLLLCCAAPLSVAGDETTASPQKQAQKATEHVAPKAAESTQFLGAANGFEKEAIKALADRVRAHVNSQPLRFPNQHWVRGAYYAGRMKAGPIR